MLVAADAVVLNDEVLGINVIDVAADAVVANEELITFCVHELVPNNEPVWVPINEPVNEPVFICDELDTTPLGNVAFTAYDDVIANEAVLGIKVILVAALAVVLNDAVEGMNVMLVAALAVVLNDELIALLAQLLVPNSEPV